MNDLINAGNGEVVLKQSSLATEDDRDDLGAGIKSTLPVIGYRGKVWWLWYQKEELALVDENGQPVPEIGVCLLRVPKNPSKRYYAGAWVQGERRRPDCWSDDGIKPHPTAVVPDQPDGRPKPTTCAFCYMDQIGSMVSNDKTKRMKACGDYKRLAVKLTYPQSGRILIGNKWGDVIDLVGPNVMDMVMLLPIPAGSLSNLKSYGAELEKHKVLALGRVTFIGFVPGESFPKMTFRYGPEFNDHTYLAMRELRNSDDARRVLERDAAVEAAEDSNGHEEPQPQPQPQPVTAKQVQIIPPAPKPGNGLPPAPPVSGVVITPAFSPGGRPVKSAVTPINTAISKPAAPPPSIRQVVQPEQMQEQDEEAISDEVDEMFNSLKLDGKTTD